MNTDQIIALKRSLKLIGDAHSTLTKAGLLPLPGGSDVLSGALETYQQMIPSGQLTAPDGPLPSISEIAQTTLDCGSFFFRKDTLHFHKDRVNNWKPFRGADGCLYIEHRDSGEVRAINADWSVGLPLKETPARLPRRIVRTPVVLARDLLAAGFTPDQI